MLSLSQRAGADWKVPPRTMTARAILASLFASDRAAIL